MARSTNLTRRARAQGTRPVVLFNKPYGVLTQFTSEPNTLVLADFIELPGYYPAGRLDKDSEGLVVLTNDGRLQARISDPKYKRAKRYWVQVEGDPQEESLARLRAGVSLKDGLTRPAKVKLIDPPEILWDRDPPVRFRKSVPDRWLELEIREGRNRQVRRMTAAIGHPTLRLIRYAVGDWTLDGLAPGEWRFA